MNTRKPNAEATTEPIKVPPTNAPASTLPEFLRLPPPGRLCAYTGLSRSYLNSLILPSESNAGKPAVKSFVIRRRGARTGVRLLDYRSLRDFILAHAESGAKGEVAK
jgi:hypothetical protein